MVQYRLVPELGVIELLHDVDKGVDRPADAHGAGDERSDDSASARPRHSRERVASRSEGGDCSEQADPLDAAALENQVGLLGRPLLRAGVGGDGVTHDAPIDQADDGPADASDASSTPTGSR